MKLKTKQWLIVVVPVALGIVVPAVMAALTYLDAKAHSWRYASGSGPFGTDWAAALARSQSAEAEIARGAAYNVMLSNSWVLIVAIIASSLAGSVLRRIDHSGITKTLRFRGKKPENSDSNRKAA